MATQGMAIPIYPLFEPPPVPIYPVFNSLFLKISEIHLVKFKYKVNVKMNMTITWGLHYQDSAQLDRLDPI
jgi:hypothetical protein